MLQMFEFYLDQVLPWLGVETLQRSWGNAAIGASYVSHMMGRFKMEPRFRNFHPTVSTASWGVAVPVVLSTELAKALLAYSCPFAKAIGLEASVSEDLVQFVQGSKASYG